MEQKRKNEVDFKVFCASDVGLREKNQDAFYYAYGVNSKTHKNQGIFAVADGVAGAGCQYSEIASQRAIDYIRRWWIGAFPSNEDLILERLKKGFKEAQREINEYAQNPENRINRYGTTLSVLVIYGERAYYCHIGDSMICENNSNMEFKRRSELHSIENKNNNKKNILTRCISNLNVSSIPDAGSFPIKKNYWYFVATDGALSGGARYITNAAMETDIKEEDVCKTIITKSRENGSKDNATIIGIKF